MNFDNSPIDYSKADSDAAPPKPGEYTATVGDDTELVETGSGGAGIKVKMRLTDGPDGSVNRAATDTVGFSQAAAWKVAQLADSAGVARPTELSEDAANAFIASIKGATVRVKIKADTYNGRPTFKIERYISQSSEAAATPLVAAGGRRRR